MKSKFNLLSSVIALAVLSACGGGGGSTAPATVADNPATVANNPAPVADNPAPVADNTTPALASANTEPVVVAPVAVAVISHKWCWSMQADQLRGTFITNETVPGDGTAFGGLTPFTTFRFTSQASQKLRSAA